MFTMTLTVEGMMCHNCEKHVNEAVKKNFKIKKVASDFEKNQTVIIAKEMLPEAELKAVIDEEGYKMTGFSAAED